MAARVPADRTLQRHGEGHGLPLFIYAGLEVGGNYFNGINTGPLGELRNLTGQCHFQFGGGVFRHIFHCLYEGVFRFGNVPKFYFKDGRQLINAACSGVANRETVPNDPVPRGACFFRGHVIFCRRCPRPSVRVEEARMIGQPRQGPPDLRQRVGKRMVTVVATHAARYPVRVVQVRGP